MTQDASRGSRDASGRLEAPHDALCGLWDDGETVRAMALAADALKQARLDGVSVEDVAAASEGFPVVCDVTVSPVGGTSAACPTFAGVVSLVNAALLKAGKPPLGFLNPVLYKNAIDCMRQIAAKEGAKGLFSGAGASYLKVYPQIGVVYFVYELIARTMAVKGIASAY